MSGTRCAQLKPSPPRTTQVPYLLREPRTVATKLRYMVRWLNSGGIKVIFDHDGSEDDLDE